MKSILFSVSNECLNSDESTFSVHSYLYLYIREVVVMTNEMAISLFTELTVEIIEITNGSLSSTILFVNSFVCMVLYTHISVHS